jgi:hypothetical protein
MVKPNLQAQWTLADLIHIPGIKEVSPDFDCDAFRLSMANRELTEVKT